LPVVDCAAIWKSTWRFLRGGSANDDEPTAYFRMQLMQTFMQGLLRVGHNSTGERSDAWSSVQSASDSLRPVLQRKVGRNDWLNSRGYWRGQFLEIDKALSDRNPQVRQPRSEVLQTGMPLLPPEVNLCSDNLYLQRNRYNDQISPFGVVHQLEQLLHLPQQFSLDLRGGIAGCLVAIFFTDPVPT